jgi:biopolymer transport protein TolR
MAFGRLERNAQREPMSDINMTPLIDVMLVLLVIFILTAPLMSSALKLDLPKSDAAQPTETEGTAVSLAITADGKLHWGDVVVTADELKGKLAKVAQRDPTQEIQLRADKAVPYGRVAEAIGLLQQASLSRIAFVTDSPAPDGAAPAPAP